MATIGKRQVLDGRPSIPAAMDLPATRAAVDQIRTRLEKLDAAVNRAFNTLDGSSPQKALEALQRQIAVLDRELDNLSAQVAAASGARQPTYLAMPMGDDGEDGAVGPPGPRGPAGPPGGVVMLDHDDCCTDFPAGFTTLPPPTGAHPSATIGLTAVNGTATTYMRSDAAPALGVGISPTWTGNHTFTPTSGNTAVMAGSFGIGVAIPTAKLHVNLNANPGSISAVSSSVLHLSGADASGATLVFDSFASAPGLIGRRAQGTAAAKSAIQINQNILILDGYGYGATGYSATARGGYRVLAAEAWSDSAQGVYVAIYTTPIGSTALAERVRITDAGHLRVVSDGQEVQVGAGQDLRLFHDGTDSVIENDTGNLLIKSGGDLYISEGQVALQTVGKGISIKEGTNAKQGLTGNLVAGVLVVANTSVTANSRIQLTRETPGGTLGQISYAKTAGTSFTITSTSVLETSTFVYSIFEPS